MWSKIRKVFNRTKRNFNLVVVGLDKAGKTTILRFLKGGKDVDLETTPTMGAAFHKVKISNISFDITDMGGQVDFRDLWKDPIKKADAVIYVVDIVDEERYNEAVKEFKRILGWLEEVGKSVKIPIFIAANKSDLVDSSEHSKIREKMINTFELKTLTNLKNNWNLQLTSAINGDGLAEMMMWIYEQVTGKEIDHSLAIEDFLIFDKNGHPIISKSKVLGNDERIAAFLSAINAFASAILKESGGGTLKDLSFENYRIIFLSIGELIGALVVNLDADANQAKTILSEIMDSFQDIDFVNMSEDEKKKKFSELVLSKIIEQ